MKALSPQQLYEHGTVQLHHAKQKILIHAAAGHGLCRCGRPVVCPLYADAVNSLTYWTGQVEQLRPVLAALTAVTAEVPQ